jgi:enterochelin esterase-like enzyme
MSQNPETYGSSDLGKIERFTLAGRSLVVWVPARIEPTTPLLIVHDAQSYLLSKPETWNNQNWGVPEAIEAGRIKPNQDGLLPIIASVHLIEVGKRINELAPEDFMRAHPESWSNLSPELMPPTRELMANDSSDQIATKVVPALAEKFGLELDTSRTAIAGSSMGAISSLYAVARHPEVYGTALSYSTHWPIGGELLVDWFTARLPHDGKHRVWLDCGTIELDAAYPPFHNRAVEALRARGFVENQDFVGKIFEGTGHNENWWAQRVELPINWWLGAR